MDTAVGLAELRAAAQAVHDQQGELRRLVRIADANGIPKTTIADTIGMSRETVRRYCTDEQ